MTSSMTSQGGLEVGPIYSFINEIITFFMITKQRAKISSLNFLCICIIRLWLQLYEYIFMTSFMTSPNHKIGQILKLIYLRQYLNYSVDQKLKMSEMLMAIFLVYSTSGITSGKKGLSRAQNGGHFENFEIWNTASTWPQIWKYRPKLCKKKYFHDDDVIDDVTGWPQSFSLYSCLGEVGSGSKLQGQCHANVIIWKFSDFCSRHTVGVAGDDIIFYILVATIDALLTMDITMIRKYKVVAWHTFLPVDQKWTNSFEHQSIDSIFPIKLR